MSLPHPSSPPFHGPSIIIILIVLIIVLIIVVVVVMETEPSPSHLQTKAYVRQLQVIDNQNLLFDMSCKMEPKDT